MPDEPTTDQIATADDTAATPEPSLGDFDPETSNPWDILGVPSEQRQEYLRQVEAQLTGEGEPEAEPAAEPEAQGQPAAQSPPPEVTAPAEGSAPAAGADPLSRQLAEERARNEAFQETLLGLARLQAESAKQPASAQPEPPSFEEDPEGYFRFALEQKLAETVEPIRAENKQLREALNQLAVNQHLVTSEQAAKQQFPDFDKVVTPAIVTEVQQNPQLAAALRATEQPMVELYRWALGRQAEQRIASAEAEARRSVLEQMRKAVESPAGAKPKLAGAGGEANADPTGNLEKLSDWDFFERFKSLNPNQRNALLRQEG